LFENCGGFVLFSNQYATRLDLSHLKHNVVCHNAGALDFMPLCCSFVALCDVRKFGGVDVCHGGQHLLSKKRKSTVGVETAKHNQYFKVRNNNDEE